MEARFGWALTLGLVVSLLAGGAPASAVSEATHPSPYRLTDLRGDAQYSRGDLTGIKVELLTDKVRLTMHMEQGSNPATWKPNETFLQWDLDLDHDVFANYEAFVSNDGTHVVAPVERIIGVHRVHACDATLTRPASTTFVIEITNACLQLPIPLPLRVAAHAEFAPNGAASGTQSIDNSPQLTSWSPVIIP